MKEKFFKKKNGEICWSYKFEKCVKCGKTKHKHKGRGLCLSCWNKERLKNQNTQKSKKISHAKYNLKIRIFKILNISKYRPRPRENQVLKTKIYEKILSYQKISDKLKKLGKIPLKMYIGENLIELPFENLEKPKKYDEKLLKEYEKKQKIFILISNFYKNEYKKEIGKK